MGKVLILDNSIDQRVYRPVEHWQPYLVYPFDAFRASMGLLPDGIEPYSHIIITGSEASILEDHGWISAQEDLIRSAVDMGKVILGSCFGHQLLARALFGMGTVARMPHPEVGWPDINILKDDPLLGKAGQTINCFVIHYDEISNLPGDRVEILASSVDCGIQAFKLNDRPVWGIQPHPEMGVGEGLKIAKMMSVKDEVNREYFVEAIKSDPRDSGWITPLMKQFQAI